MLDGELMNQVGIAIPLFLAPVCPCRLDGDLMECFRFPDSPFCLPATLPVVAGHVSPLFVVLGHAGFPLPVVPGKEFSPCLLLQGAWFSPCLFIRGMRVFSLPVVPPFPRQNSPVYTVVYFNKTLEIIVFVAAIS